MMEDGWSELCLPSLYCSSATPFSNENNSYSLSYSGKPIINLLHGEKTLDMEVCIEYHCTQFFYLTVKTEMKVCSKAVN